MDIFLLLTARASPSIDNDRDRDDDDTHFTSSNFQLFSTLRSFPLSKYDLSLTSAVYRSAGK